MEQERIKREVCSLLGILIDYKDLVEVLSSEPTLVRYGENTYLYTTGVLREYDNKNQQTRIK